MEWEKMEEFTTNLELKISWISVHNHTNVAIFISKLHEYRFVFFVSLLDDLNPWVSVHKLDPFIHFIFVFSLCNTYWGSVLFQQCLLKSLDLWVLYQTWVYFRSPCPFPFTICCKSCLIYSFPTICFIRGIYTV